ncbi:MAG: hypothetical protein ACPLPS_00500 [bacterium]
MKKILFCLILCFLSLAKPVWVKEEKEEVSIGNEFFSLHLSKTRGWLADKLEDKDYGIIFSDFHIYTDWGIYERGYVGSKEEKEGRMRIERGDVAVTAIAEGELKRKDGKIADPIDYKVKYKVGKGRELEIEIELTPRAKARKVSAFLAQIFTVPSVRQWIVNGLDGILSENMGNVIGRCWESKFEPMNLNKPFLIFLRGKDAVWIERIKCEPQAQNIFLFDGGGGNLVFFLGFLDGDITELGASLKASYLLRWGSKGNIRISGS